MFCADINSLGAMDAYMRPFLYYFARACTTSQYFELRGSRLDQFIAEAKRYLRVHFAKLGSLVSIVFSAGSWQAFILGLDGQWFLYLFDHQPPTLTVRVDRMLGVLN